MPDVEQPLTDESAEAVDSQDTDTDDIQEDIDGDGSDVVDQDEEDGETLNDADADPNGKKLPETVPYKDFQSQVHRRQELEAAQAAADKRNTELEARLALSEKAHAAGFANTEAYNQANAQAIAAGWPNVEAAKEFNAYSQELQSHVDSGLLAENLRREFELSKAQQITAKAQLEEARAILGRVQATEHDKAIIAVRDELKEFGSELDPELEQSLRNTSPEVIAVVRRQIVNTVKAATTFARGANYDASKAKDADAVPPSSRGNVRNGGGGSPVHSPAKDMSWKSDSFATIIGRAIKKG